MKWVIEKGPCAPIHKKLMIREKSVQVKSFYPQQKSGQAQIELIVDPGDKLLRTIECKWVDQQNIEHIRQAQYASFDTEKNIKHYLAVSYNPTSAFLEKAKKENVEIILLKDLF